MDVVTICNMALAHLCNSRQIEDIDDGSQEAATCSLWYETMRDLVLRDYPWPFAERYATLALVEEDPNDEWAYSYRLPSDYLRTVRLATAGTLRSTINPAPFKIGSDATGGLLFTDEAEAVLVYTARIEDVVLFPIDFVDALSLRLAHQIAKPLAASAQLSAIAMQEYRAAVARAQSSGQNEQQEDPRPEAATILAREA